MSYVIGFIKFEMIAVNSNCQIMSCVTAFVLLWIVIVALLAEAYLANFCFNI